MIAQWQRWHVKYKSYTKNTWQLNSRAGALKISCYDCKIAYDSDIVCPMDKIIYEQPLNEIIRVCLRLELLFQQIDHRLNDISILGTREIVSLVINVLNILDRPDLKAKLAKELNHQ